MKATTRLGVAIAPLPAGRTLHRRRARVRGPGVIARYSSRRTTSRATRSSSTTAPPKARSTQAGVYNTGGLGGQLEGSDVDHLASQGSLAYDRHDGLLFAVNAGSNTVSVFAVYGDKLALRQVIGSGGSFPVSIAVHDGVVYVLNGLERRIGAGLRRLVRTPRRDPRLESRARPRARPKRRSSRTRPARSCSLRTARSCSSRRRPTATTSTCSPSAPAGAVGDAGRERRCRARSRSRSRSTGEGHLILAEAAGALASFAAAAKTACSSSSTRSPPNRPPPAGWCKRAGTSTRRTPAAAR